MRVCPPRDDRNNLCDAQLRRLFDRPLHAVEFEDGQPKRHTALGLCLDALKLLRELEYDLLFGYMLDPAAPQHPIGLDQQGSLGRQIYGRRYSRPA